MIINKLGWEKSLFGLHYYIIVHHQGNPDQESGNSKAETKIETAKQYWSLACFPWLSQLFYTSQEHLPRMAPPYPSVLGPTTSTINQEDVTHMWPQANQMEAISQLGFLLPG